MSKYVTNFALPSEEGWNKIIEIIDKEKFDAFLKELEPLEREIIVTFLTQHLRTAVVFLNANEEMKDFLMRNNGEKD